MKIAVIGSGFVGQATGKGLSKHGNEVTFVDIDPKKVQQLKNDGLNAVLARDYTSITTDITMFAVPTPTKGKAIDLSILEEAAAQLGRRLRNHNKFHVVVVRSTVPPGTTTNVVAPIIERLSGKIAGKDFGIAMQPEYLREVTANEDFERPWFIMIGSQDKRTATILEKLYKPFDAPIEHSPVEEAEIQKYIHNVYNAVKIAFFNEMRVAINKNGWDAEKIFHATAESCEGIWNPLYGLKDYGPFDGSCLPKDTRALLQWGEKNGHDFSILKSVIIQNLKHEKLLGQNKKVRVNYLSNINV